MVKRICWSLLLAGGCWLAAAGQGVGMGESRKRVRVSSDIAAAVTPLACLTATLAWQDWEGLKQGALAGVTVAACSYGLKYLTAKERPDGSDAHSFPSLHTSVSFAGAAFLQRRYGWTWGIPAYAVAGYVGWARTYARKHDWLDVSAGAALGVVSAYLYTKPFARKHSLTISPVAGAGGMGIYASLSF
jgi:membrane-associated phospholipid phosphatase